MIQTASDLGYSGIALTDHEALCGHIDFLLAEKELKEKEKIPQNFKCALGNEIYLTDTREPKQKYWHYILIAKNTMGHRALRELSSTAWLNSYRARGMERVPTLKKELENIVKKYPNSLISSSSCFVAGTPVLTREGTKNIEDITSNDFIYNKKGQWEKVNFPTSRYYSGEGRRIYFYEGVEPLSCTENHQFLVSTNNLFQTKNPFRWVEAKDLCIEKGSQKNICLFPISPKYSSNNIIYRKEWEGSLRKIKYSPKYNLPDEIILTPELMRFFGLWLGDGSISITEKNKSIAFCFQEEEFMFYWNDFFEEASKQLGIIWSKQIISKSHKIELSSSSIELLELFYFLFGLSHADTKYVPDRLKHISPELDWNLFFGYALADGYFRKRKKDKYTLGEFVSASISKQLTIDMKNILQSLGIRGSFAISKSHRGEDGVNHKEAYYLSSSNKAWIDISKKAHYDNEKLKSILELAQGHDRKKHYLYNGVLYKKVYIKKIEKIQIEDNVYCLNVDSHSFCCNNVIVHNCLGSQLDGLVLQLADAEAQKNNELIYDLKVKIDSFIRWNLDLFGKDFYIAFAPGRSADQQKFNKRIKPIADAYEIKMVIECDAHYLTAKDRNIHKSFLNSKEGEREVDAFYYDAHLMDDEEAYDNIKNIFTREEFDEFCENSQEIYGKIENYNLFHNPIIPEVRVSPPPRVNKNEYKDFPTIFSLFDSENTQERQWINDCIDALKEKKKEDKAHLDELEREAKIISLISNKLGNCLYSYFNTFKHYIDLFWECGSITGPGRGSSGAFLSNYLLGITQLDPLEWNFPYYRFLNEERVELPDIDVDLSPSKRPQILKAIRKERGELTVAQVATFGTESTKAAIAAACKGYRSEDCPNGIDIDVSQYMSSLIPVERGIVWSIKDCLYGNEDKRRKPVKELKNQFDQYPGLEEIARGIEGLVCRRGQHASGVMMYNASPFETTALMRSPNGDITTQFDLSQSELLGDTKFDFLVTEICDKISVALDLLQKDHYFDDCKTKREIYNKYLHPEKINIKDERIWKALEEGTVQDVFQFNTTIGTQTIQTIKPKNPNEMMAANALMRLVAPEEQERPFDRYIKFRENPKLWEQEMNEAGLTDEEKETVRLYYSRDYGVPFSQEILMRAVMDEKLSHFTLVESNHTRKVLAKKKVKEIPIVQEKFLSQCPSRNLGNYVWKTLMLPQMSYSFSEVHSMFYSFIGIQTVILATIYPSEYWNCACLIVNSGSGNNEEEELFEDNAPIYSNEMEEFTEEDDEEDIENSYDEEDCDGYPAEVEVLKNGKKKKKVKSTNYGRISAAIGKMKMEGIQVAPPDINDSTHTFSPDPKNHIIRYGISGISMIGGDLVKEIIDKRPYTSIKDFVSRVKISKPKIVNLIKSGAFDRFGDRVELMKQYIDSIADKKKRITLQNMKMLIEKGMIPEEFGKEIKIFNFNKYLKKNKDGKFYILNDYAANFYNELFSPDNLQPRADDNYQILQTVWDKLYDNAMNPIRAYFKKNQNEILNNLNKSLFDEVWKKYAKGSISAWEMASVSYYSHAHELEKLDNDLYGFSDFYSLPTEPQIDHIISIKGKKVPLYKIIRVAGTVLDRDKTKKTVTLLTTKGVITVKIFGQVFAFYDKQISECGADGKKHVIEKSMFKRGNKIVVSGIRTGENEMLAKKYKATPWHLCEEITQINDDGTIELRARSEE